MTSRLRRRDACLARGVLAFAILGALAGLPSAQAQEAPSSPSLTDPDLGFQRRIPGEVAPPAPLLKPDLPERSSAATAGRQHMLKGVWNVYWIDANLTTQLRIGEVYTGDGVTSFIGALANLAGEACSLTGQVIDTLSGTFIDGLEQKTHTVSAFVVIRGQCPSGQLWIEAFGLPAGPVLLSGRATGIPNQGPRYYHSVALGR